MRSRIRPLAILLLCQGVIGTPPSSVALDRTRLSIDRLQGEGWQAQQIQVQVELQSQPVRARIRIGRATLQGVAQPLRDLSIDCDAVQLEAEQFSCTQARITGVFPYLGRQQFTGSARYARSNGAIAIDFQDLVLASGRAQLQAQLHDAIWQAQLDVQAVELGPLLKLAQQFTAVPVIDGSGKLDAQLHVSGTASQPQHVAWQINAQQLTVNNQAGTLASDRLTLAGTGKADAVNEGWQLDAQLQASSGQGYVEPVFVDFGKQALQLSLQGRWHDHDQLQLQQLDIAQHGVVRASARGTLRIDAQNPVPQLTLQLAELAFPGSFSTYLQPFLLDTAFKNLNTGGTVQGELQIENSAATRIDLQLQQLHADDGSANLRLDGIDGDIHWRSALSENEPPPRSTLSWQSGSVLGLELGPARLPLELWDTNVRIAEPTRLPVFDGALTIDAFRVRKAGTPQMAFMLDAGIEPINVARLAKAFGWPEFGGELSGNITRLRLEEGVLTLGATLAARIFDGEASISNMRMEGALTAWPRFSASIALKQLDLEQVTQAFSFGRITGRLSGEINGLELFNWNPVAFDARLYTPEHDRSRHRISQRAVQNIGSIGGSGGGVAAALQSGFLKFFEDFNYDRLGLSCRLVNEVCLMNGIAPAEGDSYYLVKGRGLPRIDVIGTGTRVDWPRFVAQLKAVTESEGPVVK